MSLTVEQTKKEFETYLESNISLIKGCNAQITNNFKFSCVHEVVKYYGVYFKNKYRPKNMSKRPYKECFLNALKVILDSHDDDRYVYVEGIALWRILPVHHAWLYDIKEKRMIDPTWEDDKYRIYKGIPFETEFLLEKAIQSKNSFSILDDWENDFPTLKYGIPDEHLNKEVLELVSEKENT